MGRILKLRWLVPAMAVTMLAGLVGVAQAAPPAKPVFTSPTNGKHLSLALDDAEPAEAGFQIDVSGTSAPNATIDLDVKRPAGTATDFGDGDANAAGNWTFSGDLDPGEWVFTATATLNDETSEVAEITVFVVLRYVFTWYDAHNTDDRNWVMIGNQSGATARADVFIGGVKRGSTQTIASGAAATAVFKNVIGGPVMVDSLDGRPLVVTQRTLWTADDFEEVPAVFDGHLTTNNWFTWYDAKNTSDRDWIVASNFGKVTTTVNVRIAGFLVGQKSVQAGKSAVFVVPGVVGGPVQVTAGQPIHVSRRTLWTTGNFSELVATPDRWLERHNAFPWFDAVGTRNSDWVMVANPNSSTLTATIDPPGTGDPVTVSIGAGQVITRQFPGKIGGPVFVDTTLPAVVTQRALWSSGRSFEETPAVGRGETSLIYAQSWYDDRNSKGDWLMQANVIPAGSVPSGQGEVDYTIVCPGINSSSTLVAGEVEAKLFGNKIGGPCEIEGDGFFLQSRRTLWGRNNDFTEINGLRGTTGTGLPSQLAAVTGLTVSDVAFDDGTNLRVSFTAVTGADGYWVYQGTTTKRRVAHIPSELCSGGTCATTVDGQTPGVASTFEVRPLSGGVVEGLPATASGTPVDNPPSAPTWPAEAAVTPGEKSLVANPNDNPESDVIGYRYYYAELGSSPECDTAVLAPSYPDDYTLANTGVEPEPNSTFTITGLTNGTDYCVIVTAEDAAFNESDPSDPMPGTPAAVPPVVTVTAPNGGETFRGDDDSLISITWTDTDPNGDKSFVSIDYSVNGGTNWISIDSFTANDGSFMWNPPPIDSQQMRIRVTAEDLAGNTGSDTSNANFAIDSTAPDVNVTKPTAADLFAGGEVIDVDWTQQDANPGAFSVAVSTNGGTTYTSVTCTEVSDGDANANTKRCRMALPSTSTTQGRVRVTVNDTIGHVGTGQSAVFTIDALAPGTPVIKMVDGTAVNTSDPEPHATGNDSTPETVVEGGSPFAEAGTVKIYVGGRPGSCSATPAASKTVAAGQASVTFNAGAATDFNVGQEGRRKLWVCMTDDAGNLSPVTADGNEIVYELDTDPPDAPTGLTAASGPASGQVTLDWTSITNELLTGYKVYRVQDPQLDNALPTLCGSDTEGTYAPVGVGPSGVTTTTSDYVSSGMTAGERYCFKVSAVDDAGNEGALSEAVAGVAGT